MFRSLYNDVHATGGTSTEALCLPADYYHISRFTKNVRLRASSHRINTNSVRCVLYAAFPQAWYSHRSSSRSSLSTARKSTVARRHLIDTHVAHHACDVASQLQRSLAVGTVPVVPKRRTSQYHFIDM